MRAAGAAMVGEGGWRSSAASTGDHEVGRSWEGGEGGGGVLLTNVKEDLCIECASGWQRRVAGSLETQGKTDVDELRWCCCCCCCCGGGGIFHPRGTF
jgi:hypothetical protein